jgi:hypothetical protein
MPTEHTVTSYQFDELSDRAKEVARAWFRDGALDYEWWESTYEDAAQIGLKITGFDLGRAQRVEGKFTKDALGVGRAILNSHGAECETYKRVVEFLAEVSKDRGPNEEQEEEFLRDIRACYWDILNAESEYLTSDECVDETIRANEYDFTADGRRFRY